MVKRDPEKINYEELIQVVRNNLAVVMEDPYFDGYNIEVTNEVQFLKKTFAHSKTIYIVVKFAPASILFGQTVLGFSLTAISEQNHCFVCQKLLTDYAAKYNLEFENDYTQQIYETPTVLLNFNEVYEGFRGVLALNGTFVITKSISQFDMFYHYTDENNEEVVEQIDLISSEFHFNNNLDSQAFYGTHDIADSVARLGSFNCGCAIYLFTDSQLIKDCVTLTSLVNGDLQNVPIGIDNSFDIEIRFKAKDKDGNYLLPAIRTKTKLVSFDGQSNIGEIPILSFAFAK